MKLTYFLAVLFSLTCIRIGLADTSFVYAGFDALIYLPDNWVLEQVSDSQINLYDQTWTYGSQLSVMRHNRNTADFPIATDWTRAHFIGYKLVCETSAAPWGAVLYYDSTAASKQGNLWAPELYCTYYSADTVVGAWSEYIRFTASGNYGYELWAMGDTADMLANLGAYAGILQTIEIPGFSTSVTNPVMYQQLVPVYASSRPEILCDILGRTVGHIRYAQQQPARGIYVAPQQRAVLRVK